MHPWIQSLKKHFSTSLKKAPLKVLHGFGAPHNIPVWNPKRFDQMATEGYCQNVIVYRAVTLIARNLATVPWILHQGEKCLSTHPLLDLLENPNPLQTSVSFLESLTSYLLLSGNAYVELVSQNGADFQLYLLRPDRVQLVPQETSIHYLYTVDGQRRLIKPVKESVISPILHLKTFHPLNDWYGMSPLEAASFGIDQHNEIGRHNLSILHNGGRPSGALILNTSEGEPLSEENYDTLREEVHTLFQGSHNAGRVAFLEGDMRWQEMSISPKDMDFVEGKYLAAREIAQAYGVPAMLVGVPGDATFANYKEARLHLWEDTILPLLDKVMAAINRWICPLYGPTLQFTYDAGSIPALVVRRESLWTRMEKCSFLTDDEKREALGYGPRLP